jgi:hypothetical protein
MDSAGDMGYCMHTTAYRQERQPKRQWSFSQLLAQGSRNHRCQPGCSSSRSINRSDRALCMRLGWPENGMLLVRLSLLLYTAAATAAGVVSQSTCAPLRLDSRGPLQIPHWALQHSSPVFPTDNQARSVTGRELHELSSSEHGSSSRRGRKGGLVVLFYLAGDPPSL